MSKKESQIICSKRAILLIVQPITLYGSKDKAKETVRLAKFFSERRIPVIVVTYKLSEIEIFVRGMQQKIDLIESFLKYTDYVIFIELETIMMEADEEEHVTGVGVLKKDELKKGKYTSIGMASEIKCFEKESDVYKQVSKTLWDIVKKESNGQEEGRDYLIVVGGYNELCQRNYIKFLPEISEHEKLGRKKNPVKIVYFPGISVSEAEAKGIKVSAKHKVIGFVKGRVGRRVIEGKEVIIVEDYEKFMEKYFPKYSLKKRKK